ncbi:glycosyltransferase family 4 protein [Planosporangium flavigriseum]|uniref:Uncharacterized protein n=1 Tax=Planosporangium flavigriseum TaxID=373681 RepID=A0A8J3LRP9_9ACTN|nr:glycosyltransferase family 4 protein [Planosporangium flavigriseum]NJC67491.1 glycosyltransferase family 4 protein [Planosporangium flavigriseum]GIG75560.1 hypothetical protein Pfl04_39640 [Planosporangium flavigriseum]
MSPTTVATGIDLPLAPSCGSTILCSDTYRVLRGELSTTFFCLPESSPGWDHGFESVVHCQAHKAPYGPDFDAYVTQLTRIVARHLEILQPDVIHAQHLGFGLSLAFCRVAGNIPIVAVAHGTDVIAAAASTQALAALTEVVERSAEVVLPTEALRRQVDELTAGQWTAKLSVVGWGIPLDRVASMHRPSTARALRLLHAGRLDQNKSSVTAVEAMALTKRRHHLRIIGDGDQRESLRRRAIELGVSDQVSFSPFVQRHQLWATFADHDAFLFTTVGLEAFGLVGIEAQAHGLPVMYSAVAGLADSIGDSGLPYRPGDARQLSQAIDLLADDPGLRHSLSTQGIANAHRFDIHHTARGLAHISSRVRGYARVSGVNDPRIDKDA